MRAGAGDDSISTGGGGDWIDAGEGDDTIDGGANGTSLVNTWDNEDVVSYDAPLRRFAITMSEGESGRTFTVHDKLTEEFGGLGTDTVTNVERLQFTDTSMDLQVRFDTPFDPNMMGSTNNIRGTEFNDVIDADQLAIGQNTVEGDNIQPGGGNDAVYAGAGGDHIQDGAGNDFYDGGANGTSLVNSWSNQDVVQFAGAQRRYTVDVLTYDQAPGEGDPINVKAMITAKYDAQHLPANVVRVTDKLPDTDGGDGVNYLINVEQLQFTDGQVSLGVSSNQWTPMNGVLHVAWTGTDNVFHPGDWVGNNNYNGGILGDRIEATGHHTLSLPATTADG